MPGLTPPSHVARQRREQAQAYAAREIKPILDEAVEFILIERQKNPIGSLHAFLQKKKAGKEQIPEPNKGDTDLNKILDDMKQFLHRVTEHLVIEQPQSALDFLLAECEKYDSFIESDSLSIQSSNA